MKTAVLSLIIALSSIGNSQSQLTPQSDNIPQYNREFQMYFDPNKFEPFESGMNILELFLKTGASKACILCTITAFTDKKEESVQEYIRYDTKDAHFERENYVVQVRNKIDMDRYNITSTSVSEKSDQSGDKKKKKKNKKGSPTTLTVKKNDLDLARAILSPIKPRPTRRLNGKTKVESKIEVDQFPCRLKFAKSMKVKNIQPNHQNNFTLKSTSDLSKYFAGVDHVVVGTPQKLRIITNNARRIVKIPVLFTLKQSKSVQGGKGDGSEQKQLGMTAAEETVMKPVELELVVEATYESVEQAVEAQDQPVSVEMSFRVEPQQIKTVESSSQDKMYKMLNGFWSMYDALLEHPWIIDDDC